MKQTLVNDLPERDASASAPPRPRGGWQAPLANWSFLVPLTIAAAALVVLYFIPPQQSSLYPRCLLHQWTGWQCPGCGGLRATHELLHGRVARAFHLNPLSVFVLPLASLYAARHLAQRAGRSLRLDWLTAPWWLWTLGAAALAFTLARNAV